MKRRMRKAHKARLLALFTIGLAILCGLSFFVNSNVYRRYNKVLENQLKYYAYVDSFGDASAYLTSEVRAYAANGDRTHYDNYWHEVNTAKNREKNIEGLRELGLTNEEETMISTISGISNGLIPLEEEAMKKVEAGDLKGAVSILYGDQYVSGVNEIGQIIGNFNNSIQSRVKDDAEKLNKLVVWLSLLSYASVFLTLLAQVYMVYFVLKELVSPTVLFRDKMLKLKEGDLHSDLPMVVDNTEIGETSGAIQDFQDNFKDVVEDICYCVDQMAQGNFNTRSKNAQLYVGDLQRIVNSLRQISLRISNTLLNISDGVDRMATNAESVSHTSQDLAQGATEQSNSIQELSTVLKEISDESRQTATAAGEARNNVNKTEEQIGISSEQVRKLNDAMDNIATTSEEIGKIINTIESFSFQTNILSLNAAVEAARAGSSGKGFAVVSDEVRNLAAKSDQAAKASQELIARSKQAVSNGIEVVESVTKSLNEVHGLTSNVAESVGQVSDAAKKQNEAVAKISVMIDQITQVVQNNAATSQEFAATSEELSSQAAVIKEMMSQFQVRTA